MGRQFTVFAVAIALSGCMDFRYDSGADPISGRGAVVADEPRAVLVARNVLSAGGNAADAAVALYFALAVTYPASAGLGGGGVCVARRAARFSGEKPKADALDFTSPMPSGAAPAGLVPVGIPGNVRGMFALQARYGRLRWGQVVLPAESLARFGTPVSRAFAKELSTGVDRLHDDSAGRALFRRPDGTSLREGDHLNQIDLASVLSSIRSKGPADFYSGGLARALTTGARDSGGYLPVEDLRRFRPKWMKPIEREFGRHTVYFPASPIGGGLIAADLWKILYQDGTYGRASSGDRDGAIIKAAADVLARQGARSDPESSPGAGTLPDPAITGFAVMDGEGGAVACAVTLNGRFGSGRVIRGTGIVAAAGSSGPHDARYAMAPMVIANRNIDTTIAAAAPSGDASAPTALISVALRLLRDDEKIEKALGAARVFPGLADKTVYVEQRNGAPARLGATADLQRIPVPSLGRVNFIYCPGGLPLKPESCVFGADPRGFGYAVQAQPADD